MTITKRPKVDTAKIDEFIEGAPDSAKKKVDQVTVKRFMRGNREQISVTLPLGVADELDAVARKMGLSRAAVINVSIRTFLEEKKFC